MSQVLELMAAPFVACVVLIGIHAYLGMHVIQRKVIFVDLALAQIAALGATVGFLFGMDPTSHAAFVFSMAFTFLGAAIFSLTRMRGERVPQEAVIGLADQILILGLCEWIENPEDLEEHFLPMSGLMRRVGLWARFIF